MSPTPIEGVFDMFAKLKDPADVTDEAKRGNELKRKPSHKVMALVDEIMSLTLIEAADLCDLCQQKLAERSMGSQSGTSILGRSPFPHPSGMFAGLGAGGVAGMIPPYMPGMGMPILGGAADSAATQEAASAADTTKAPTQAAAKTHVNVKLVGFEPAKKVAVVKEVRSLTSLGLKEAKEFVEDSPKVLRKAVGIVEAEELKKKLESVGGKVELE
eukprot:GHVT01087903.1.p2 GENE.GHVT01087903.1~~GHVT01087903.1.p2  ORF type:complete len:215 (-),score=35.41 GHVT01087903.1:4284-4928(-)